MPKINSNAKYLKALVAPKSKFKDQQIEVIKLYQERKIENLKTAEKIIEQLHSRGQKLNEKGLASLSKYSTAAPATGKIQRQVATKIQKAKPLITSITRKDKDALTQITFNLRERLRRLSEFIKNDHIATEIKDLMKNKKINETFSRG